MTNEAVAPEPIRRETVVLEGHIVDSLILPKVLDLILDAGAEYEVVGFDMGRTTLDPSLADVGPFLGDLAEELGA